MDNFLERLLNHYLHGSGWDTSWNVKHTTKGHYECLVGYHCMDEHGYYDGWIEIIVILDKNLTDFAMKFSAEDSMRRKYVTGKRDYYEDVFSNTMAELRELLATLPIPLVH
jgi:hypothetical protein